MEENREPERDKLEGGELHVKHGKVWRWFDNFWYHHKWKVIVAAIGIFAVVICMVSMFQHREPDYYFCYAGSGEFTSAQKSAIVSSLARESGKDGVDADVSVTFLFYMTTDQISRYAEEHEGDGTSPNGAQIGQNRDLIRDEIQAGNALIFFMDPEVLDETQNQSKAFLEIREYAPAGTPDEAFHSEYGIDLRYTVFASDPSFAAFPKGTVIAIRNGNSVSALFQQDKALENRARYEALLLNWLAIE